MVNTIRKGSYFERKAKEILERHGFVVEKTKRSRFNRNDFFGLFDLIAVSKETVKFIQVADRMKMKEWVARAKRFPLPANCSNEVWLYREHKGFRVFLILNEGVTRNG